MASLIDLAALTSPLTDAACDVCVVGAGAAGLYLASTLARRGLHVVIVEAGGEVCGTGASVGIDAVFSGREYPGAIEGRAFGWGGSTSRWGGLLVPHSELDLRKSADAESITWSHIVDVVRERTGAVSEALGLGEAHDFLSFPDRSLKHMATVLRACGLASVSAVFLPFTRRNLTYLVETPRTTGSVRVFLNAAVSGWSPVRTVDALGEITRAEAVARNRNRLRVSAGSYVVAAGAIESARVLLEMDRTAGERMLPKTTRTGCYLSDHLSCSIAVVHPEDRDRAARTFGPVFSSGRLRSFRFVDTLAAPRHFAHFIFDIDNPGFRLAKDVLSRIQSRRMTGIDMAAARSGLRGLTGLAYSRFIKSRLLVPEGTPSHLQLDVEQAPVVTNRISLDRDTDRNGRPGAVIHWDVSAIDRERIQSLSKEFLAKWPLPAAGAPRLIPTEASDNGGKPHDAYHPVGTCRMGTDGESTVGFDLRVKGTRNVFVLSTGVLPTAGTANPTFTMLCLGDKLAAELAAHSSRPLAGQVAAR